MNPAPNSTSSSSVSSLMDRYHAQPRAMRWAIWAAIGIILYFPIETALTLTRQFDTEADAMMRQIHSVGTDAPRFVNKIETGSRVWGGVALPDTSMSQRSNVVQSRIASILANNGIRADIRKAGENSIRLGEAFEKRAEDTIAKVTATSFNVQFDASPDVLSSILADLESQPEIARVSKVTLSRKVRGALLTVNITAEAWSWTYEGMNEGGGN